MAARGYRRLPGISSEPRATAVAILAGLALGLAGLAALFSVPVYWPDVPDRYVLAAFALAMAVLLAFSIRPLGCATRVLVAVVLSIGIVGFSELLAWTMFPALHHDLVAFSPLHVRRMILVAILGGAWIGDSTLILSILTIDSRLERQAPDRDDQR